MQTARLRRSSGTSQGSSSAPRLKRSYQNVCVRSIEHFAEKGLETTLFVNRARKDISNRVTLVQSLGGLLKKAPYRLVAKSASSRLAELFKRAVVRAEPGTIAYFWPDAPTDLVRHAKAHDLICVREMINNPWAAAGPILDAAYEDAGFAPAHGITSEMIQAEAEQMKLFDFVFSSNAEVDAPLVDMGVGEEQILKASFGWVKSRFDAPSASQNTSDRSDFRVVFVGLVGVRKGVPTLFEAWEKAGIDGELVLAGAIEPCLEDQVADYTERNDITHLGHVEDVASLYRTCDVFVFPTFEEGGPQVTYEAAACGAPVITTNMGVARLFEDGISGVIFPAGDADALAHGLQKLANDQDYRERLASEASAKVDHFEYANVGKRRAELLLDAVERWSLRR